MSRGLLVGAMLGLVGCYGVETEVGFIQRQDGQEPQECRLDHALCAVVIARDLMGTPLMLRAHLVERVGSKTSVWEVAAIEEPNMAVHGVYDLVIRDFVHQGVLFLAVTVEVSTSVWDRATAKLDTEAPQWVHESIEHVAAADLDEFQAVRRTGSWLQAQHSRRTAPLPVHADPRIETPTFILPPLRGQHRLEHVGWAGPFVLDGTPVSLGLIELLPALEIPPDKMPIVRP